MGKTEIILLIKNTDHVLVYKILIRLIPSRIIFEMCNLIVTHFSFDISYKDVSLSFLSSTNHDTHKHTYAYATTRLNESVKLNLPSTSSLYHLKSTFIQKKLSSSHTVRFCCSYSATLYNPNHFKPHSKFFVKFVITKSIQFSIFSMNILFCGPFNFQLIKRKKSFIKNVVDV